MNLHQFKCKQDNELPRDFRGGLGMVEGRGIADVVNAARGEEFKEESVK